jgi:hypothetical protein
LAECSAIGGIGRRRWSVLVAQAEEQACRSQLVLGPSNQTDGDACIGEGLIDEPPDASAPAGDERDRPGQRGGADRGARHRTAEAGAAWVCA